MLIMIMVTSERTGSKPFCTPWAYEAAPGRPLFEALREKSAETSHGEVMDEAPRRPLGSATALAQGKANGTARSAVRARGGEAEQQGPPHHNTSRLARPCQKPPNHSPRPQARYEPTARATATTRSQWASSVPATLLVTGQSKLLKATSPAGQPMVGRCRRYR